MGLQQVAKLKDDERRSLLRKLTDEEYKDVIRVLASYPILDVTITTEVVDDEEQHVVTAGAIVTVTLLLERRTMESIMNLPMVDNDDGDEDNDDDKDIDHGMVEVTHEDNETAKDELSTLNKEDETDKEKKPLWRKPQKKKGGKKGGGGGGNPKQKSKNKKKDNKGLDDASAATSGDTAQGSNSTVGS